jgi:hypothetical protein
MMQKARPVTTDKAKADRSNCPPPDSPESWSTLEFMGIRMTVKCSEMT